MNNDELNSKMEQALVSNNGSNMDYGALSDPKQLDAHRFTAGGIVAPNASRMDEGIISEGGAGIVASNSSRMDEGIISDHGGGSVTHHTGDCFNSHESAVISNNGAGITTQGGGC